MLLHPIILGVAVGLTLKCVGVVFCSLFTLDLPCTNSANHCTKTCISVIIDFVHNE